MTVRVWDQEQARELYRVVYCASLTEVIAARRLGKPLDVVLPEEDFVRAFRFALCATDNKSDALDCLGAFIERRLDEAHPGYPYMTRWFD